MPRSLLMKQGDRSVSQGDRTVEDGETWGLLKPRYSGTGKQTRLE